MNIFMPFIMEAIAKRPLFVVAALRAALKSRVFRFQRGTECRGHEVLQLPQENELFFIGVFSFDDEYRLIYTKFDLPDKIFRYTEHISDFGGGTIFEFVGTIYRL